VALPLSSSDIIAVCAAVIALCALGATLWQGFLARRHNILSVRPHIEVEFRSLAGEPCALILRNTGLGPAFLQAIAIAGSGTMISLRSGLDGQRLVATLMPEHTDRSFEFSEPDGSSSLAPGAAVTVLSFPLAPSELARTPFHDAFLNAFHRRQVVVTYTSIYGVVYQSSTLRRTEA
jgi:hypothetical protein